VSGSNDETVKVVTDHGVTMHAKDVLQAVPAMPRYVLRWDITRTLPPFTLDVAPEAREGLEADELVLKLIAEIQ